MAVMIGRSKIPGHSTLLAAAVFAVMPVLAGCTTLGSGQSSVLASSLQAGILAGEIGIGLNSSARALAATAEYEALESGRTGVPVNWKQSDRVFGNVVPQQPFSVGATNCRRYVHTINLGGTDRSAAGTACRSEDGVWEPLA